MMPLVVTLLACGAPPAVEAPPAPPPAEARAEPPSAPPPPPVVVESPRLDLNATPEERLRDLPGVGPRMAHEFVEYRPYASVLQFRKEMAKYVDADAIARFETLVYVPVDPDASDPATLAQLPGIDPAEAEALVAGRPYPDRAAFLAALDPLVPEDQRATARGMLVP